ncbi:MAG: type III-B CRISPR module RAMP protein Cmr4 [Candidatus Oleimicrobiaceae bacterium]
MSSYDDFRVVAMATDPIHVGTGGARLGRVDLTIVRDPVTRVPKIPGSSLAGVYRSYVAMHLQDQNQNRQVQGQPKPYFPDCAGLGQPDSNGQGGHCGQPDCPVCVTFGFARGQGGGFAGLAAFSDAHVLLFPVPTREGPFWVTSPEQLRIAGVNADLSTVSEDALYQKQDNPQPLNLGWLLLKRKGTSSYDNIKQQLQNHIPAHILDRFGILPDKLFSHVVNSNLEVRTSVSINPATGAAEEGALFSYEALPRTTILAWTITCRNPKHFKISGANISAQINNNPIDSPDRVKEVAEQAHPFLEHLGIGGMGTRGMGRLRVLKPVSTPTTAGAASSTGSPAVP